MVNAQRGNLMDSAAPNPSVETLLHAFIPETFIDHSHATAFLAFADQPDAEHLIGEIYGDRVACVPYVMPGFELAKRAALAYRAGRALEGLALIKHGLFTFGASARESYERMIALVTRAEAAIARPHRFSPDRAAATSVARGSRCCRCCVACLATTRVGSSTCAPARRRWRWPPSPPWPTGRAGAWPRPTMSSAPRLIRWCWTRQLGDLGRWRVEEEAALRRPTQRLRRCLSSYFRPQRRARRPAKDGQLDAKPRVIALPGLGLVAAGRTAAEAAIVGDIAEAWAGTLLAAEAIGSFEPVGEADTFDMEYWSLEKAKLGKRAPKPPRGPGGGGHRRCGSDRRRHGRRAFAA